MGGAITEVASWFGVDDDWADDLAETATTATTQLTTGLAAEKYGSFITEDWLSSRGIKLSDADADAKIQAAAEQERQELDEEWFIKERKGSKTGKESLLTRTSTGLGVEAPTSNSLLKG